MSALQILIWLWVITFLIDVIWYRFNPDFLKWYYDETFYYFEYSFFIKLVYAFTLIVAPIIFVVMIAGEIRGLWVFWTYKWKLKRKIDQLDDNEAKEYLDNELKKIKL